ncbi:MAG: PASTA domain-containing protein, partial [Ignavibacteria bacterium]
MKIKKVFIYLIILVVLIMFFDKILMPYIVWREEVHVPNVIGMTYEQGKLILIQNNLEPTFGGERYDSKYPKGTIILQRPTADKTVKVGRRIYLIISSGNVKVEVPNIRYKSVEEANVILS